MRTTSSIIYIFQSQSMLFEMTYPRSLCTQIQESSLILISTHESPYNFLLTTVTEGRLYASRATRPDNYCAMQDGEALLPEFVARKIQVQGTEDTWLDLWSRDLPISVSFNVAYVNFSVYYRKCHFFLHSTVVEKYYWIFREKNEYKHDSKTNRFHVSSKQLCEA